MGRCWGNYKVDVWGIISFLCSCYYFVLLVGIDKWDLFRIESRIGRIVMVVIVVFFFSVLLIFGLVFFYIFKSWLGINFFEGFLLGFWDWLKGKS